MAKKKPVNCSRKHTPGRDHDRESGDAKKRRFSRRAAKRRQDMIEEAVRQREKWDSLSHEQKQLLTGLHPKYPRPS